MGHLINPIALRLGSLKSWEDFWFVKNIYYPEFFNGMLKIRNYLYYFLTEKKILRSGLFLSNFFIIKYNKIYIINIYIYHIDFEKLSFQCINDLYSSFFNYNRIYKIRKINNYYKLFKSNLDIFFLIVFFYKIFYKKKKKKNKILLNSNFFFKSNDFINYYNNILIRLNKIIKNFKLNKKYENNLFINLLYKNKIKLNEALMLSFNYYDETFLNYNFTSLEFVMYILKKVNYNFNDKLFNKIIKIRRLVLFLYIFKFFNSGQFKLNYNFLLFFLIILLKSIIFNKNKGRANNVIRNKNYMLLYGYLGYKFFFKELKIITKFLNNIFFILNKIKNISYKFYFLSNNNITARWLCRYIGIKLKNNYSFYSVLNPIKKELYKLCKTSIKDNNKLKSYNYNNLLKKNNLKYKLKFKNIIREFLNIYIKENYLYYLDNNNYIYDVYLYFNNKTNKLVSLYKFFKLYKYIYINIFKNNYWELSVLNNKKLLDGIIYKIYNLILINFNDQAKIELKKLYISIFFIRNLFNFYYFRYIWFQIKKFNLRNVRNNIIIRSTNIIIGYKLVFKGRFSRKERASDIWYMGGKIPLNTLSIKLDYFFFTIPIKNSAISIKITLYKRLFCEKFKYLLKY